MLGCDFAKRAAALVADLLETLRDALVEHYAVQRELGRGGMATVFLAEDLKHHRPVAIKVLHSELEGGTGIVADFGIARAVSVAGEERHLTQTGTVVGTPMYMSPELATGSGEIDGRSDQYSLACVTYEMLVGAPPFTGPTAQAVMARHSLDMVSPPSIVRTTIPDAVEDAILRALAKTPADRFPTT